MLLFCVRTNGSSLSKREANDRKESHEAVIANLGQETSASAFSAEDLATASAGLLDPIMLFWNAGFASATSLA
jgi:hypothetical protein